MTLHYSPSNSGRACVQGSGRGEVVPSRDTATAVCPSVRPSVRPSVCRPLILASAPRGWYCQDNCSMWWCGENGNFSTWLNWLNPPCHSYLYCLCLPHCLEWDNVSITHGCNHACRRRKSSEAFILCHYWSIFFPARFPFYSFAHVVAYLCGLNSKLLHSVCR